MSCGGAARTWALAFFFAGGLSRLAGASPVAEVQAKALDLSSRGEVKQAMKLLQASESRCPAGSEGEECRRSLLYVQGYVQQIHAGDAETGKARNESLSQAASAYEKLLATTPAHKPSIDNLLTIYREQGKDARAAGVLERAIKAAPTQAGDWALKLGDSYFQDPARREQARDVYEEAARAYPFDGAAALRIVQTYEADKKPDWSGLLARGQGWEESFPAAAREAYETVIQSTFKTDAAQANRAATLWTALLARRVVLSLQALEALPEGWDAPQLNELRAYLAKPEEGAGAARSWQASAEGRAALAQVGVALGRGRAEHEQWREAEAIWRGAASFPPATVASAAQLDLLTELASLYAAHPETDPEGRQLHETEIEPTLPPAQPLALLALQRYRTALGLIFAERGGWSPQGRSRGALHQLREALRIADSERWETERFYQPLAGLRERLAEGLAETGDNEAALARSLEACRAFLDTDDLAGAARTLEMAGKLAPVAGPSTAEMHFLAEIVGLRTALGQKEVTPERIATLFGAAIPEIGEPPSQRGFERRQRFKILADIAADRAPAESSEWARQALGSVLRRDFALVGAGDLLRLKKLQKVALQASGVAAADPEVVPAGPGTIPSEGLLPLSLPTDAGPAWVRVSPDAIAAVKMTPTGPS